MEDVKINKMQALQLVNKNGFALKFLSKKHRKDKDVVLAADKNEGFAIADADKKFLKNVEVAKEALRNNIYVYLILDKKLMKNKQIMKLAGFKIRKGEK